MFHQSFIFLTLECKNVNPGPFWSQEAQRVHIIISLTRAKLWLAVKPRGPISSLNMLGENKGEIHSQPQMGGERAWLIKPIPQCQRFPWCTGGIRTELIYSLAGWHPCKQNAPQLIPEALRSVAFFFWFTAILLLLEMDTGQMPMVLNEGKRCPWCRLS